MNPNSWSQRYTLVKKAGSGGMGTVFVAKECGHLSVRPSPPPSPSERLERAIIPPHAALSCNL